MGDMGTSLAIWSLAAAQVAGLFSAGLARFGEGSVHQTNCQRLFMAAMAMMGLATMGAMLLGPLSCIMAGTTLAVMVVTATWDVRGGRIS
jgi:hypothetical protein